MSEESTRQHVSTLSSETATPSVAIVILLYQSADYIAPCLESIARLIPPPDELIIVDNASTDGSINCARETCSRLGLAATFVALERNLGCCGGNNVGWRAATSDAVVFLNPDTQVTPSFVGQLRRALVEQPRAGIVGCKIFYPGGKRLQHAGACILGNGRTEHFGAGEEDRGQFDEVRECDYVTGAGFIVRREVLQALGGFDEDFYPAYFEEVDLCTRARRLGWRVLYWPDAVMIHHESVSLGVESERFLRLYHRMRLRYCLKHFGAREWLRGFLREEWRTLRRVGPVHRRAIMAAWRDALVWGLRRKRRSSAGGVDAA